MAKKSYLISYSAGNASDPPTSDDRVTTPVPSSVWSSATGAVYTLASEQTSWAWETVPKIVRLYSTKSLAGFTGVPSVSSGRLYRLPGLGREEITVRVTWNSGATQQLDIMGKPTLKRWTVVGDKSVGSLFLSETGLLTTNAALQLPVILDVTYSVEFASFSWVGAAQLIDIPVQCNYQNAATSFTVLAALGAGSTSVSKDVTLVLTDAVTNSPVDGASVYVDSYLRGSTNADGVLVVRALALGTHTLRIVRAGYIDSDVDSLDNDSFVVT